MNLVMAPPDVRSGTRSSVLVVLCAAPLLVLMNYVMPMTTLPDTARSLGAGISGQTWILNGIALGLAAVLLAAGSIADDHGRKRVLVIGSGLLAVSSVLVAVATTPAVFVVGRVLQGAASATLLAASLGIVGAAYAVPAAKARAAGLWGAMVSAGIALGPLAAGALAEAWTWRAAYWAVAAGAVVLGVAAAVVLDESRAEYRKPVDVAGVGTLGVGLAALLAGLTEGRLGWTHPQTVALLVAGVVLLAGFVAVERRGRTPMLDLGLFRHPPFLAATGGAFLTGVAIIGLMSYVPAIVQHARGYGALAAAGLLAIWSGTSALVAHQARRLRYGGRHQVVSGLLFAAAGDLLLLGFVDRWSAYRVVAALVVAGVGSGLVNGALPRLAVASVPLERAAMGSGANNTARYVGSSLGVAMIVAIATGSGTPARGANIALVVAAIVAAAGAAGVLALRERA